MKLNELNKTFDKIILKHRISDIIQDNITVYPTPISDDLNVKCSIRNRKSVITSFHQHAQMYGLEMLDTDESGIAFELYDKKHDTTLRFTNKFIEENLIDYKNQGKKSINLEDIFRAYDELPDVNKDAVHGIKFLYGNNIAEDDGVMGWSQFLTDDFDFNQIGIPHYLFNHTEEIGNNYERVLAHESAHCRDYPQISDKMKKSLQKTKEGTGDMIDTLNVMDLTLKSKILTEKFTETYGGYKDSVSNNARYLQQNGVSPTNSVYRNKSSDYGATKDWEDYAEASSMVITGYRNPDNPNATVRYNGRAMQYREWVTVHPYQAQYLIKDLFGVNVGVDEILKVGKSTPLVPDSQTINEMLEGILND